MALSQKRLVENLGLDMELYRKITNYDFRAGIVTMEGFASQEAEKEGKQCLDKLKYSHATTPEREEEIMEEVTVVDTENDTEVSTKPSPKEDAPKPVRKEKRPTGKFKKVKNDDYITKDGNVLEKLYTFVGGKDDFKGAKKA